jgi:hypothetical protein
MKESILCQNKRSIRVVLGNNDQETSAKTCYFGDGVDYPCNF